LARNDVYENPADGTLLLDVQSNLLAHLYTRVCIPLIPLSQNPGSAKQLNPIFEIAGDKYVLKTEFISAVPASILRRKVENLGGAHDELMLAIDFLFLGF